MKLTETCHSAKHAYAMAIQAVEQTNESRSHEKFYRAQSKVSIPLHQNHGNAADNYLQRVTYPNLLVICSINTE